MFFTGKKETICFWMNGKTNDSTWWRLFYRIRRCWSFLPVLFSVNLHINCVSSFPNTCGVIQDYTKLFLLVSFVILLTKVRMIWSIGSWIYLRISSLCFGFFLHQAIIWLGFLTSWKLGNTKWVNFSHGFLISFSERKRLLQRFPHTNIFVQVGQDRICHFRNFQMVKESFERVLKYRWFRFI